MELLTPASLEAFNDSVIYPFNLEYLSEGV